MTLDAQYALDNTALHITILTITTQVNDLWDQKEKGRHRKCHLDDGHQSRIR